MKGLATESSPLVLVASVGAAEGARAAAAALACAGSDPDRAALLVDVGARPPRPTLLASTAARALEERLLAHLPRGRVAARGQVCHLASPGDGEGFEAASAAATVARGGLVVIHVPEALVQPLLAMPLGLRLNAALLRAEVCEVRALLALVYADLSERGIAVAVLKRRLPWVAERRALFGTLAPGSPGGLPGRTCDRLLATEVSTGISVPRAASRADSDSAIRAAAAVRPREDR
ncbi:MAG TPA: hypothetical protein VMT37_15255 [Solirubrobacterales bacterium]|nr:hypothetical protein [Solirubrobacterales bacterium]